MNEKQAIERAEQIIHQAVEYGCPPAGPQSCEKLDAFMLGA